MVRSSRSCWPASHPEVCPRVCPTPGPAQNSSDLIHERQKRRVDRLGLQSHGSPAPNPSLRTEQVSSSSAGALVMWDKALRNRGVIALHAPSPLVQGPGHPRGRDPLRGGKDAAVLLPLKVQGPLPAQALPSPQPSRPLASLPLPWPRGPAQRERRARAPAPGRGATHPRPPPVLPSVRSPPSSALKSFS